MNNLDAIAAAIHAEFEAMNARRDAVLNHTRELVRLCAEMIRTVLRRQWNAVDEQAQALQAAADELRAFVAEYPVLEHTGYTQDAFKEYVEAMITRALVRGDADLPTPEALGVLSSTYLNGLAEAASELRRHVLNLLRDGEMDEARRLLDVMDTIYDVLFSFGYPDAITGGLRHRVDQLRAVLERTRGDVTASLRQELLLSAMRELEERLGVQD
ncbi:MAG: haloacid dehalogenase [Anaerolineae bacterium]|nr:haloacid dehalogenase [Anaerolineae bacterium]